MNVLRNLPKSMTRALIAAVLFAPLHARAEVSSVTVTYQFGLSYLPLMVMEAQGLVEKEAKARGIDSLKTQYSRLGGAGLINDSILSGSAQFGAIGVPSLLMLWEKTRGNLGVKSVGSLSSMPMFLNTIDPSIKSLADFTPKHKIALPTTKVSVQAVTLQMAAAQAFGMAHFDKLDPMTVTMAHPDGMNAMMTGKDVVSSHFTAPPFQYMELRDKRVRTLLSSYDVLGGPSTFVLVMASEKFKQKNPKVFEAFVAAFRQAQAFITSHRTEAAQIYLKISQSRESEKDVLTQLANKDLVFTMVPQNLMKYATFMGQVKTIKTVPASWKDLVFDHLHNEPGS